MSTTYPLASLAPTVTDTGISALSYVDILQSLKVSAQQIFGADVYLEADSQDGQLLAIFAQAIYDCGQTAVAVYNSFSPATAYGEGLSNVVKINHITRSVSTKSQVNVDIGGVSGTLILNGQVADTSGQRWNLPASVSIPPAGVVTVTATADLAGALAAPIGSVTSILTPVAGWQTVNNTTAATPGQPVETDAQLRVRQQTAPALSASSVIAGISASIKALAGVSYSLIYENNTNTTDSNGLPPHSISCVVKGGDAATIAKTIYGKKSPGVATYGTTAIAVTDASGASRNINFYVPTEKPIKVAVTLVVGAAYNSTIGLAIKQSIVDYINAMPIGETLIVSRLYYPALLRGDTDLESYKITTLTAALAPGGTLGTSDVPIAFNEKATAVLTDITVTV